jgi:Tol biopolymer transport system component
MHQQRAIRVSMSVAAAALMLAACSDGADQPAPTSSASVPAHPTGTPQPFASGLPKPVGTPDAGRILFNVEGADAPTQPVYLDGAGLHVIPVAADSTLGDPIWASATQIYFDSARSGHRHIYRMNIDGSQMQQITAGTQSQDSPQLSPDGTHLVFGTALDNGQDQGLHVARSDGSEVHAITSAAPPGSSSGDDPASYDPTGTKVVFIHVTDPNKGLAGLWTMSARGGVRHRLTADNTDSGYPRWSPNGQTILFTEHNESNRASLWSVPAGGGAPRPVITPTHGCAAMQGSWSPDGQEIVYTYFCPGWGHTEIRVADADGSHPRTLWTSPTDTGAYGADWSNAS